MSKTRTSTRGENNPRATLTDGDVELLRSLFEADRDLPAAQRHWTAPRLAAKFEISVRHVWNLVGYKQRVSGAE